MKRISFLLLSSLSLLSCDASLDHEVSFPPLDISLPNRQIAAVDDNPLQVDIVVNNGPNQRFTIPPGQNNSDVRVTGLLEQETNRIQITWSEILNQHPVILAQQDQQFSSSGSIIVDTEHQSQLFDNDADGVSNLDERNNGACVWYADNVCLSDGGLDVPPDLESRPQRVTENDVWIHAGYSQNGIEVSPNEIDNGTATIFDLDFSNEVETWSTPQGPIEPDNNIMCISLENGQVGLQDLVGWYDELFLLQAGRYAIQFDVLADRLAPISIGMSSAQGNSSILDHYVQGTNEWKRHTIRFQNNAQRDYAVSFQAIRSAFETTYCFDNIKLVKME